MEEKLFSYHFFQDLHNCLKDLFINNNISNENFTKISNLLKSIAEKASSNKNASN